MSRTVWLSGRYLRSDRARISVHSRTLTLGVGVFESLRVVRGVAPLLDAHLKRLADACRASGLPVPRERWSDILERLAARNRVRNGRVRITIGDGFRLATLEPLPRGLEAECKRGIALASRKLQRPTAHIKGTARLSLWIAEREFGAEVLLLSERGHALETTRSSFFALTPHGLETAPTPQVLPGIARGRVLELARELKMPVRVRPPAVGEVAQWRAAFVTNAVRGLRPVTHIDGARLPLPEPGSMTRELQRRLEEWMQLR